jgi:hypothetical protein
VTPFFGGWSTTTRLEVPHQEVGGAAQRRKIVVRDWRRTSASGGAAPWQKHGQPAAKGGEPFLKVPSVRTLFKTRATLLGFDG